MSILVPWMSEIYLDEANLYKLDFIPFENPLQFVNLDPESLAAVVWPCYLTLWPHPLLYLATKWMNQSYNKATNKT